MIASGLVDSATSKRKIFERNDKSDEHAFVQVLSKFAWPTFRIINYISPGRISCVHYPGEGGEQEIHDFRCFSIIYRRVLLHLFVKSFWIAKSYRIFPTEIKILFWVSGYPRSKLQSPDFSPL